MKSAERAREIAPQGERDPGAGLRQRAFRGGAFLLGRQVFGVVLAMIGEPLIARVIGPAEYGIWVAAVGMFVYSRGIGSCGIEVYLMRKEGRLGRDESDQAFTLLAAFALIGLAIALSLFPLAQLWMKLAGFSRVAAALLLALPISLTALVPLAILERSLDYQTVATAEIGSRVVFYAVALTLVFEGWGVWGLVGAWWLQQLFVATFYFSATQYRPRLSFESSKAREIVGYGFGYSLSTWIYQLRILVNPLVVGRYAGAAAVGYVGLAERLVSALGFAKGAAWRIAIPLMGRLQHDKQRMARAISEGMTIQGLALAPLLLGLSLVLAPVLRFFFGMRWLPVVQIYPFVGTLFLVNSIFALHASALYALRRNGQMVRFELVYVGMLVGAALFVVPRIGWLGYGWAELLATPSYAILHMYLARDIGSPSYRFAGTLVAAFTAALFWRWLGPACFAGLLGLALWPTTWKVLKGYLLELMASIRTPQGSET